MLMFRVLSRVMKAWFALIALLQLQFFNQDINRVLCHAVLLKPNGKLIDHQARRPVANRRTQRKDVHQPEGGYLNINRELQRRNGRIAG